MFNFESPRRHQTMCRFNVYAWMVDEMCRNFNYLLSRNTKQSNRIEQKEKQKRRHREKEDEKKTNETFIQITRESDKATR